MYRKTIACSAPLKGVRLRRVPTSAAVSAGRESVAAPVPASFPQESGKPAVPVVAGGPDIRPLLESLQASLGEVERRRQQSLGELQQVALELSVAVASHLVFEAIAREDYAVEELVRQAVEKMGLNTAPVVSLHPADLDLLRKRMEGQQAQWNPNQLTLRADVSVARGGCRVDAPDGRVLVSDITSRLSEVRRHWMEELDDAQIERRRSQGEGGALRRFPDRRETA